MEQANQYDYIIAGGGMAGLSLAYYLNASSLAHKKILILDKIPKTKNDRTWCFWEKKPGAFESILFKKWGSVLFGGANGSLRKLDIAPYSYKMLRGIDFYNHIYQTLSSNKNISFHYESIITISDQGEHVTVKTEKNTYTSAYVFDSTGLLMAMKALGKDAEGRPLPRHLLLNVASQKKQLLQHFLGWVIKVPTDIFDTDKPVMMNFGIDQKNDCRFMYLLPISKQEALLEYTLFTTDLLTETEYESELKNYLNNILNINDFVIEEKEFGIIPMSDETITEQPSSRIVNIGTAGGYTNAATGYTFYNTQKRLQQLVGILEKTDKPTIKKSIWERRHELYAAILLNVLQKKRYPAAQFFDELYLKNSPKVVFQFLDGETTFWQEVKLMWSTPILHFSKAALEVISKKII